MDQLVFMPFLVGIVGVVVLVGLPILTWIIFRLLAHRERMAMIRAGMSPQLAPLAGRGARGVYEPDAIANLQLRRGVSVTLVGLGLLIGLSFIGFHNGEFEPGPWLLGGLIPLFVGVAQVVNALLAGARFGAPRAGSHLRSAGYPSGATSPYEPQESESQKRPPV